MIVQIEHIQAIENFEAILNTPTVYGFIIGPYDFSDSLGCLCEFERPEVKQALKRYEAVCDKMMRSNGFHDIQQDPDKKTCQLAKAILLLPLALIRFIWGANAETS